MYSLLRNYKYIAIVTLSVFAFKAEALEIFYDAQLDSYIKKTSATLVKNSHLEDVNIYLIKSSDINAFATENKDIALYSGLIDKSDSAEQVQGVIAHELGHLIAQHHIKSRVKNQTTGLAGIAGTVLGVGAVIAGAPDAGLAAILGGNAADISKQLSHSREHENEADSIAIKLLKKSEINTKGLADFFKLLERQEKFYFKSRPEFLNTHPTTSRRKSFVQNNVVSFDSEKLDDTEFDLFKAKLYAFTESSNKTINRYSIKKDSSAKYLALAIGYSNIGDFKSAYSNLNKSKLSGLKDIWYFDMMGQFLYQESKLKESINFYLKSYNLGNKSWILDFQIAESYFALKNSNALNYYFKALSKFDKFNYTLKRISDFYAQDSQMTMAHLYIAKYALKQGNEKLAKDHIGLADRFYKKEQLSDKNLKNIINEILEETKKESK